jgi:hypothetical protein
MNVAARLLLLCALLLPVSTAAAQPQAPSRVEIAFNRYYDYEEMTGLLHRLVEAYPELLTLQSLGQSVQGREMWLVTLNNPATGPDTAKPAMWIDGNVHGGEIQGGETVLYSIWYLAKSYGEVEPLTELMDRVAFYFVPMVNPDGRAGWFAEPNVAGGARSGQRPMDNDFDGLKDEDPPEDLNGDGRISRMYRFDPNGRYRRNRDDPRILERVEPGVQGELSMVGSEGIDNDGDGRINEDGLGGYDMNRNWPSDWQPNYIQRGSGEHPFSYPETRTVGMFILDHPNIAAAQAYHNTGGMILRGPGVDYHEHRFPRADLRTYDRLGIAGEEMLPFYRYMIIHSDLYTVHGGFINWISEGRGVIGFTNELWSSRRILQTGERPDQDGRMRWQDRVLFGQTFTDYTEFDHPTLGKVLIGGTTKYSGRIPPGFMLEEECHRNFAFTAYHADHMPLLSFPFIDVKRLGDELWQMTVEVENEKIIPTRTALAAQNRIGAPDRLEITGEGATVVASGRLMDRFDKTMDPVEHRPHLVVNNPGIPGEGRSVFRFIVSGAEGIELTLTYSSEKARDIEAKFALREQTIEAADDE